MTAKHGLGIGQLGLFGMVSVQIGYRLGSGVRTNFMISLRPGLHYLESVPPSGGMVLEEDCQRDNSMNFFFSRAHRISK